MYPSKWRMDAQIPVGLAERLHACAPVCVWERQSDREGLCHTVVQDEDYE